MTIMKMEAKLKFQDVFRILLFLQFSLFQVSCLLNRDRREETANQIEKSEIREINSRPRRSTWKSMTLDIKMPGVTPRKAEEYLCTSTLRLPSKASYIVEYEPHAHATTAHHILLYGCRYPASNGAYWKCPGSTCRGSERIIYAWAKNAKAVKMPQGVGFAIGGFSGIDYIVMQIHYAKAMKPNEKDYSGIKLHLRRTGIKHLAEVYSFASATRIPPHSIGFPVDIACRYKRHYDMIPFAFRTHAHSTGRVIAGYRVRKGKWKLIGIGNPQLPQAFYPIAKENRTRIHYGDILAARCTYDTPHRSRWTNMGPTSKDEMCNYYMMFYKIYRKGARRHYENKLALDYNECGDFDGLAKHLHYPPSSMILPSYLKVKGMHHHHHMGMGRDPSEEGSDLDEEGPDSNLDGPDSDREEIPDENTDEFDPDDRTDNGDDSDLLRLENKYISGRSDESPEVSDKERDDRKLSSKHESSEKGVLDKHKSDDGRPSSQRIVSDKHGSVDKLSSDKDEFDDGEPSSNQAFSHRKLSESHQLKDNRISNEYEPDEEKVLLEESSNKGIQKSAGPNNVKSIKSSKHSSSSMDNDLDDLMSLQGPKEKKKDGKKTVQKKFAASVNGDWPYKHDALKNIGQVTGLALDKTSLVVLHRAGRVWRAGTFDQEEELTRNYRRKIAKVTVLHLDPRTGAVIKSWGQHRFYLPHGLTIDSEGNTWITDVGAHQVLKFSAKDKTRPEMVLGEALMPGEDDEHFCKPTDVAVESSGVFYVADGYCNNRIMKFTKRGDLIRKWGQKTRGLRARPGEFNIPHSLALDEARGLLYVADRENGRIQCFDTHGKFKMQIRHEEFGGRLFAVSFTPANGGLLMAVSGKSYKKNGPKPSGFTMNAKTGKILAKWSPFSSGFSRPHDVQATPDNSAIFVAEIGPNRVWKFNTPGDFPKRHIKAAKQQISYDVKPTQPHSLSAEESDDEEGETSYRIKKPVGDENPIVPAVVIVAVLATPITLICAAAFIQHLRFRSKREKALKQRNSEALMPRSASGCFWCCKTKKYYYDNKRGFDKLIGEDDSEESSDDYFVRKGAI